MLDLRTLPLGANLAVFGAAAALVWVSGSRLAGYADALSERTRLGHALIGMLLLGVATSLPEVVTTLTGALIGNARLVTGNLFGGVAMQVTVLALVDFIAIRGALTYVTPQPVLLFQGVMLILMLAVALAGAVVGEPFAYLGIGATPLLLAAMYVLTLRVTSSTDYLPRWRPVDTDRAEVPTGGSPTDVPARPRSHRWLAVRIGLAALAILVAGSALTLAGDALSDQTGLGASFVGVSLVAASTSLPELSTTLEAVRRGNVEMAVSSILGTNLLELALFLLADVTYRGGAIIAETDRSGTFAAVIGIAVTGVLLLGLLERRDRTVARMGIDSLAILLIYGVGLAGLYHLR